ncbi:MAG: QueT transporter family protein [Erysipelotrichaceae bacterium]
MNNKPLNTMIMNIMVAAVYTAVSFAIPVLSFGPLQIRFAEVLCLLVLFDKKYILGVTLGCLLTNYIGAMMGINLLGYMDVLVGTFATYISVILVYHLRHIQYKGYPILSMLMPCVVNGLIIGAELAYVLFPTTLINAWVLQGTYVFMGEFIACVVIGMIVYPKLKELKIFSK